MIVRDTAHGFITADISIADVSHLMRALDCQIRRDHIAHPYDAEYCRRLRATLADAATKARKSEPRARVKGRSIEELYREGVRIKEAGR